MPVRRSGVIEEKEASMQYMLLIYGEPGRWESLAEDERKAVYARYEAFADELRASNALVDGAELQSVESATSVRVRDGETQVTDGPFAETKETLGGYFLIEAESLDEAIEWAAKLPGAAHGVVEVRPLVMSEAEVST
jgi:hypothetical protein